MSVRMSAALAAVVGVVAFGATWILTRPVVASQPVPPWIEQHGLSPADGDTVAQPLAPAESGQLECTFPRLGKRHCQGLTTYRMGRDGRIDALDSILVSERPMVVMQVVTPVHIEQNQVCGTASASSLDRARFTVDGRPAEPNQIVQLRHWTLALARGSLGRKFCTSYVRDGDRLIAQVTADGVRLPDKDQKMIWVSPSDGYTLGL